jgi:hypothetical protein
MAENPIPRQIPPEYYLTARKILVLPTVEARLNKIAEKVKRRAGAGHEVKNDRTRDRVRVQVFTASNTAKAAEASDKTLSKAFAAERTTPRRPL